MFIVTHEETEAWTHEGLNQGLSDSNTQVSVRSEPQLELPGLVSQVSRSPRDKTCVILEPKRSLDELGPST